MKFQIVSRISKISRPDVKRLSFSIDDADLLDAANRMIFGLGETDIRVTGRGRAKQAVLSPRGTLGVLKLPFILGLESPVEWLGRLCVTLLRQFSLVGFPARTPPGVPSPHPGR
jgi:hypothetical protein